MILDYHNQDFFSPKEAILDEVERELQKVTIDWIGYVDRESKETNFPSEKLEVDDETVVEGSEAHNRLANTDTNQGKSKKNAVDILDQSWKLLRSLNDTFSRCESKKFERGTTKYADPAAVSQELKRSTSVIFQPQ